jgi:hypothetical protein
VVNVNSLCYLSLSKRSDAVLNGGCWVVIDIWCCLLLE